ncbi:hypothetical protein LJC34_00960 [Oscillospiraceae bacterium OttesenSCG-928-G22]|nr:hypothetical protein [Oscillospiraceae bacterium OttesenSCG-928-G22]
MRRVKQIVSLALLLSLLLLASCSGDDAPPASDSAGPNESSSPTPHANGSEGPSYYPIETADPIPHVSYVPYITDASEAVELKGLPAAYPSFSGTLSFLDSNTVFIEHFEGSSHAVLMYEYPHWVPISFPSAYVPVSRLDNGQIFCRIYDEETYLPNYVLLHPDTFEVIYEFTPPEGADPDILISPDGARVIFSRDLNLYAADRNFANETLLVEGHIGASEEEYESARATQFVGNNRVLFNYLGYEWLVHCGAVDLDGENSVVFENTGETNLVPTSANDLYFYYSSYGDEIGVYTASDGAKRSLYQNNSGKWLASAFDPDGAFLAIASSFTDEGEGGLLQIISAADGKILREYARSETYAHPFSPVLSPDGRTLLYIDINQNGNWAVFQMDMSGYN